MIFRMSEEVVGDVADLTVGRYPGQRKTSTTERHMSVEPSFFSGPDTPGPMLVCNPPWRRSYKGEARSYKPLKAAILPFL